MGRVEQFREIRKNRFKYRIVLFAFIILLITGICISDFSVNSVLLNENRIEMISMENKNKSNYTFSLLNHKFNIDTSHLINDYQYFKSFIFKIFER